MTIDHTLTFTDAELELLCQSVHYCMMLERSKGNENSPHVPLFKRLIDEHNNRPVMNRVSK